MTALRMKAKVMGGDNGRGDAMALLRRDVHNIDTSECSYWISSMQSKGEYA